MNKIHLGSGKHRIEGYINIDLYSDEADIKDDIITLDKFKPSSIELIYSSNSLEHFGKFKYKKALTRWYELLKPDGILRLSVPDFEALCKYYTETKDLDSIYSALYAGQDSEWNFHYWCWDFEHLKKDLEAVGFRDVHRFDKNILPIRDWSTNYVPYRKNGIELPDEEWFKGTEIALNVEAFK
jgi:predicted SAM-dependent methyltransferase